MLHDIWSPTINDGIAGERIAIVGYSHYLRSGEGDSSDLTTRVLKGVVEGTQKYSFFTKIRNYFGYNNHAAFWPRVYFLNFIPEAIGIAGQKFAVASEQQNAAARERFLSFIEEAHVDKVFVYTRKGWKAFPEKTIEELAGGICNPLLSNCREPSWGTYITKAGKRVLVCGFEHPMVANSSKLREQTQAFLKLHSD